MKSIYFLGLLLLIMTACVKKELLESIPEPMHTGVKVTIDWAYMEGDDRTETAVIKIADKTFFVAEGDQAAPVYMVPGHYTVYLYTICENIMLSGNKAVVTTLWDDKIVSKPGIFYSVAENVEISEMCISEVTLKPMPRIRKLNLKVELGNYTLGKITGSITGIAGEYDILTDTKTHRKTVYFDFDGISSTVNIFGIMDHPQLLCLDLIQPQDSAYCYRSVQNIHELFEDFDRDKQHPKSITIEFEKGDISGFYINE